MRPAIIHVTSACFLTICVTAPKASADGLVQSDFQAIGNAMEAFYLNTVFEGLPGYFTTVENLDDTLFGTAQRPFDAINDGGGALVFRPEDPSNIFRRTLSGPQWGGPYLQSYSNGGRQLEAAAGDYDEGNPFDIRGDSPIYFFTPIGLLEPRTGDVSLRYYGDEFDSYTLVSFGPDGAFDGGDDLIRSIATFPIDRPIVSSGRLRMAKSGIWELEVRGYLFGVTAGDVLIDGMETTGAPSDWSPQSVRVQLADKPANGAQVTLRLGNGTLLTRSASIIEEGPAARIGDWNLFDRRQSD